MNYWREAEFEVTLDNGWIVAATAHGEVLPPEGAFPAEVRDLTIAGRVFDGEGDHDGFPFSRVIVTPEQYESIAARAAEALCG